MDWNLIDWSSLTFDLTELSAVPTPGAYRQTLTAAPHLLKNWVYRQNPYVPEKIQPAANGPTTPPAPAYDPEAERRKQQGNTIAAYFRSIGLGGLADWAIKQSADGYTEDYIYLEMRNQPVYKQRFPAMQSFIDNFIPFTEKEYMDYEQTAQALDQRYGLPDNMIYNAVTDLLINRVDAEELADRAAMAGAAAVQAPEDFKTTMRDYYGIDDGGLAAYFLDPDNAVDSLKEAICGLFVGDGSGTPGYCKLA